MCVVLKIQLSPQLNEQGVNEIKMLDPKLVIIAVTVLTRCNYPGRPLNGSKYTHINNLKHESYRG